MQGSDFIFALLDKDYRFWQIDATGMVTKSSQPYFLEFSPDGWSDISIQNVRNKRYWGIDRSVTVPLSYVQDGAKILKYIFLNLGVEESVYLSIAKQELVYTPGVDYGYWYKSMYRGEVDLSTYTHAGAKVTCNTLEDGLPKFLKSNESTTYEFPMNVQDAINVQTDGIRLHNTVKYGQYEINTTGSGLVGGMDLATVPLVLLGQDGDGYGLTYLGISEELISDVGTDDVAYMKRSDNWGIKNEGVIPITFPLNGHIDIICGLNDDSGTAGLSALFLYFKTSMSLTGYVVTNAGPIQGATQTFPFSFSITLLPGEALYCFRMFNPINPGLRRVVIQYQETSEAIATAITRKPITYVRAFRPQYLFNLLVNKFTESNYSAEASTYFDTYNQVVFTCGNAIRGFDDAVMKISWSDFFQFWDCFDSVGIKEEMFMVGFDSKVNLENSATVVDLPEPSNFKVTIAKEYLYNELEIGYPEIKNEVGVLNGNEEFNTKYLFSLGSTKSPSKIDKVSKIKASCYEIELIRVTTIDKTTTDYKADNDLFVLHVEAEQQPASGDIEAYYKLDRSLNTAATGLIEPSTVYNIFFSPKRNMYRNGPFLRSSMYLADNLILKYQTVDKNNKLVAAGVIEKADEPLSTLGGKFFLPVIFDFDVPAPNDLINILDIDPTALFRFPFYGRYYTGLLQKVGIAPSSRKEQNYQLMSTADNDLTDLINFYG